jgi:hypothetical protein
MAKTSGNSETETVADLALVRAGREGAEAPGRRRGRPYRYDPGPMAGARNEKDKGNAATEPEHDGPWSFWR